MKNPLVFVAAFAALSWSATALAAAAAPAPAPKKGPTEFVYSCTPQAQQLIRQARDMGSQGHASDSLVPLREAVKADPNCVAARYYLGSWGADAEAKKMADEAFAAAAKLPEAERTLIESDEAARKGDVTLWTAKANKVLELMPDCWEAYLVASGPDSYLQKFDAALAKIKKATELNPTSGPAWTALGYAYVNLKRPDDAIGAFRKYAEVMPSEPNAHDSLADVLLDVGKLDEAEAAYRKALEVSGGKFYLSWSGVATVRCAKTDWQGCREAFTKMKASESVVEGKAGIDRAIAWTYVLQGKGKEALKTLDAAEKEYAAAKSSNAVSGILDERFSILFFLGRNGEALKAVDAMDKADLSALPDGGKRGYRIGCGINRALALARLGKPAEAEKALTAVDADIKATADDLWMQSWVAVGRAEIALAKKDAKTAVQQLSMCPDTHAYCRWQLALAQDKAGDKEAAKLTREGVLKRYQRSVFYLWVRNQIDTKKVTKQEPTAAADQPTDKKADKKAADKKPAVEKKPADKPTTK